MEVIRAVIWEVIAEVITEVITEVIRGRQGGHQAMTRLVRSHLRRDRVERQERHDGHGSNLQLPRST